MRGQNPQADASFCKGMAALWPLRMNAFSTHLNPRDYDESSQNMSLTTLGLKYSGSGSNSILHVEQSMGQEVKFFKHTGRHCPSKTMAGLAPSRAPKPPLDSDNVSHTAQLSATAGR